MALYYQWFLDVEVMIFLGFGFLMTFLRRYSYSAVAFNFFISAFVMIYSVLVIGAVQQVLALAVSKSNMTLTLFLTIALLLALFAQDYPDL